MYKQTIELQIDMNKEIKKLLNFLKSEYLGLWAMPLLLVVLYETGALTEGTYAGDARMEYILQSVCILLTVCLIPLSLRLFSLNLVKRIKELPLQEALKSYRLWSEVRLALLMAPAILGISFYYLTLNTSGLFCACMALIASLFCVPSRKRLLDELDLPEDIND